MRILSKLSKYIIVASWRLHADHLLSDKAFLCLYYRWRFDRKLNLKNPRTFNEKLQWLKLYNRKPEYTTMVDKYKVKEYVAEKIGSDCVTPVFGVWKSPSLIEWDNLPDRFVLKCSHDCGSSVICKNKASLDKEAALKKLEKAFDYNYYYHCREGPYKNVEKCVFAEEYLEDNEGHLNDYKFFCFNGEPKYCQVIGGRESVTHIDFFDKEWHHQPFQQPDFYPFSSKEIKKPECLDQMWEYARILSTDLPFARVDFYEVDGKVYFGEITFFPTSGMGKFKPEEWDTTFGDWINLDNVKK